METNLSLSDSEPSLLSRTCLQSQAAEAKIGRERKQGRRTIQPCGHFIETKLALPFCLVYWNLGAEVVVV